MQRERREPTWPFLVILACLFVLSATAPRAWRSVERQAPPHLRGEVVQRVPEPVHEEPVAPATVSPKEAPRIASPQDPHDGLTYVAPRPRVGADAESALLSEIETMVAPPVESMPPLDIAETETEQTPAVDINIPSQLEETPEDAFDVDIVEQPPIELGPRPEMRPSIPEPRPVPHARWSSPVALLRDLVPFKDDPVAGEWAREVTGLLEELGPAMVMHSDDLPVVLDRLVELSDQSAVIQNRLRGDDLYAMQFRQVRYALIRRVNLYWNIVQCGGLTAVVGEPDAGSWNRLSAAVHQLDRFLGDRPHADTWRGFFQLQRLRDAARREGTEPADEVVREVATQVWHTLHAARLSEDQLRFFAQPPIAAFLDELSAWQSEPMSLEQVLAQLERYEKAALPADARDVALLRRRLRSSENVNERMLGENLAVLYDNANLRVVVSSDLLNRMAPPRDPEHECVHDTILGKPVHGESVTETKVAFRMIPDPNKARLALVIEGDVFSQTQSESGPAVLYNDSYAHYTAEKALDVTPQGITTYPAVVEVENKTELRDVETPLDPIPILGSLAEEIARDEVAKRYYAMTQEVRMKVAAKAKNRIDTEADARLGELNERFQSGVLQPLAGLSLGPEWLASYTTDSRMVLRWRLGGPDQLGGHTLRPWAPADSLASCQIHQSAINNFIARLSLEGTDYRLPELQQRLRDHLNLPIEEDPEADAHSDVFIRFAERNAAYVEMDDGRLGIVLSIDELRRAPYQWRDFQVRAYYRPHIEGNRIELERDGVVQLAGKLDLKSQIALRGVFSKTFSKNKPWDITPKFLEERPGLERIAVTQFQIDDGWIGIALGPKIEGRKPLIVSRESSITR